MKRSPIDSGRMRVTDSMVPAILERVATLEQQVKNLVEKVTHIDLCVDTLKRAIWTAAGGISVVIFVAGWYFNR